MKSNKPFLFVILGLALTLPSCYHEFPGGGGGGGGGNGGSALVNLTVTATPSSTFSFPFLYWPMTIGIVNSAGVLQNIATSSGVATLDLARLQTDSLYLGHTTLAAGSYTQLQVQFLPPVFGYFYNNTNGTLLSCASGVVCLIPGTVTGYGANTVTVPITYSPTANTNTGIRINFDLSKAVTNTNGMTFDFTQAGAITLSTLPPAASSQTSGLDTMDNFTGVVTATTSTTITVASFASEARTFTVATNAEFDDPFNVCGGNANFACLAVNQNVSVDGVLNSDSVSSFTANEVEFLDPAPATNELEGVIITPLANNQFKMALTNGMGSTGLIDGVPVTVNLNNASTYFVDPKSLGISSSPLGFQSSNDLVMGQVVMLQGGTLDGANTSLSGYTRTLLRYSSIGGTVSTPSGTQLTLTGVPPFLTSLLNNSVIVQTFPNTAYDNVASFGGLASGANASVRGLYLNPNSGEAQPLLAAKIRTH